MLRSTRTYAVCTGLRESRINKLRAWFIAGVVSMLSGSCLAIDPQSALAGPGLDAKEAVRVSQAAIGREIRDFTLLDREGRPVLLSRYRGKPLLVSFIYTGCFQVCPVTTRALQKAVESSRDVFGTDQFNIVSIGFNQPADSPQALKSFALQHGIDQKNWDFLSPHPSIVEPLAREFGFNYVATPAGFDHVLQVSVVDARGRIYRQIYGETLNAASLGEPLKQLMRNAPIEEQLRLEDLIDRVRILCTVYDPKTGKYRVKYDLLLEIIGGAVFALAMIWFFATEWWTQRRSRRRVRQLDSRPLSGASFSSATAADFPVERR